MAQRQRREEAPADPESIAKKKKREEAQNAERRYRELLDKRDALNQQSRLARDRRNALNEQKGILLDEVQELKKQKDALVGTRREHITLRDRFHSQAKALIAEKRKRTAKIYANLPQEVAARKAEIRYLEFQQQTVPTTIPEERELIDDIRKKSVELKRLEATLSEQSKINTEVTEIDGSIDDLFKRAEEEHQKVVGLSQGISERVQLMEKRLKEGGFLLQEGRRLHQEFMVLRTQADSCHQKAMEMRDKAVSVKQDERDEMRAGRDAIRASNQDARRALGDQTVLERKRDEALEKLLKNGKLRL